MSDLHQRDRRVVPPLGFSTKLAYGLGQGAMGIKNFAFNIFLFFYYSQVLGLDPVLASAVLFISLGFDAITDPLAGSISDSLRSRLGRRHGFMYASAIPMALAFYLVWSPPSGLGQLGLGAWMLTWTVLSRGASTLFSVPHWASAPPSPRLSPARSAANGRQGRRSTACSAWKPRRVSLQRVSTPPTMAASMTSVAMRRCAEASGLALDVQAVEIIQAGPVAPVS